MPQTINIFIDVCVNEWKLLDSSLLILFMGRQEVKKNEEIAIN